MGEGTGGRRVCGHRVALKGHACSLMWGPLRPPALCSPSPLPWAPGGVAPPSWPHGELWAPEATAGLPPAHRLLRLGERAVQLLT